MAGEWIKMRHVLPRHPKVIAIATALSEHRDFIFWWVRGTHTHEDIPNSVLDVTHFDAILRVTCASLLNVWAAAGAVAREGFLRHARVADLDDMGGVPGLGAAMAAVGWAVASEDPPGVSLPNFREWNVPHGARKDNARRCREYRGRKRDATRPPPSEEPPGPLFGVDAAVPAALDTDEFKSAWEDWKRHRRETKHTLKPTTEQAQLKKLAGWGPAKAVASIRRSIEHGWQGLFEPEAPGKANGRVLPAAPRQPEEDRIHAQAMRRLGLEPGMEDRVDPEKLEAVKQSLRDTGRRP